MNYWRQARGKDLDRSGAVFLESLHRTACKRFREGAGGYFRDEAEAFLARGPVSPDSTEDYSGPVLIDTHVLLWVGVPRSRTPLSVRPHHTGAGCQRHPREHGDGVGVLNLAKDQ
jgi:hypothetical protein